MGWQSKKNRFRKYKRHPESYSDRFGIDLLLINGLKKWIQPWSCSENGLFVTMKREQWSWLYLWCRERGGGLYSLFRRCQLSQQFSAPPHPRRGICWYFIAGARTRDNKYSFKVIHSSFLVKIMSSLSKLFLLFSALWSRTFEIKYKIRQSMYSRFRLEKCLELQLILLSYD